MDCGGCGAGWARLWGLNWVGGLGWWGFVSEAGWVGVGCYCRFGWVVDECWRQVVEGGKQWRPQRCCGVLVCTVVGAWAVLGLQGRAKGLPRGLFLMPRWCCGLG